MKEVVLASVEQWCQFYTAFSHKRAALLSPTKKKKEGKIRESLQAFR